MVEKNYGKYYDDYADNFDLDDFEENYEPEEIEEIGPVSATTSTTKVQMVAFKSRSSTSFCRTNCHIPKIPDSCKTICQNKVHTKNDSSDYLVEKTCADCIINAQCDNWCKDNKSLLCQSCDKILVL